MTKASFIPLMFSHVKKLHETTGTDCQYLKTKKCKYQFVSHLRVSTVVIKTMTDD